MRSHTGDRPYACQTCGDRFARSDLLSRHVNKCHTPGGLANATSRKQARNQSAASDDKKRRPCDECTQRSTKCDFGRPSCNNCSSRGSKCSYPKTKRPRRNTNPSPNTAPGSLPEHGVPLPQEPMINSFGHYQEDLPPFNFHYPPPDNSITMPPMFDNGVSMPNPASSTFMGSPEAPSLSFSAATSESADSSSPWNGMDLMGLNNVPGGFDGGVFHDPNAPSYTSSHKFQASMGSPFSYNVDSQHEASQIPLTTLHQRPASASYQRHPIQHHQRHRSSPSLDGSNQLLNQALLRSQNQQYPAITPTRLYMHRGSVSASDSGTDYESTGRPGTASEYADFPSPMSLVGSESGSTSGIGRAIDDMGLQDPTSASLLSMGPMMLPGIGMGTGLTPQVESPSRPSMTQRQSTFGDLKAFWNECIDGQGQLNGEGRGHSLAKMTSMPCLKTPRGDATPRAAAVDPLTRLGQLRPQSRAGQTPRAGGQETKELDQYRSALNALPAPSIQMAPKMKAAVAKQEESDSKSNVKSEPSFPPPFAPGTLQDDAWRSLINNTGSYITESTSRPSYKRLPSQTLGPESSKRAKDGDDNAVLTDDDDDATEIDYKQSQQEWHRRMSLPVMGRSGAGASRLRQPVPVTASGAGILN
ncbi:hypothetical protein RSOLAG1IB_01779 [Rhizoctonia solani AG-1 IB]|uniref:Zn(2)-C6 fungal-type domain-containing protein n=2 Tax=Thanatephorus cucumeris (strain AG1-IB / isolate 7/3/14) TaxID=1108050 RepID=A0A0B7FHX2_THACB|nr:hypothetical protein RSOLAG1IB_01779 [Rhizoctonia solani AG-1 IB]